MTVRSLASTSLAGLLVLALVPAAAAAAPARWQSASPDPKARDREGCRDLATGDPALDAVLRALVFQLGDERKPLAKVRVAGLSTLKEEALWDALGGQPARWDAAQAALLLRRIVGLGIFAKVDPIVEVSAAGGPTLVVNVTEHPTVRRVVLEGASELPPEDLLEELLESPSAEEVESRRVRSRASLPSTSGSTGESTDAAEPEEDDEETELKVKKEVDEEVHGLGKAPARALRRLQRIFDRLPEHRGRCPDPVPPRDWLARAEGDTVFPGIVWKGAVPALERVQARLFERGYQLSSLQAELSPEGTLTVRVDEGKAAGLQVQGVAPRLEGQVRALLGVEPGKPFVQADLDEGIDRVQEAFPFLRPQKKDLPSRAQPEVEELPAADGVRRYHSRERPVRSERRWFTVEGGTVVVYLTARRAASSTHIQELLRHTQVTSFAPGLEETIRLWDPENRAHLVFDLGGNVNSHRAQQAGPTPERWRFDGRVSAKVQVPDLRIAELGVAAHSQVDTGDRWRLGDIDSYTYSLLINRPDRDYFRREGLTAFLTVHLLERLTAGLEYRRDRYRSLVSAPDVFTLFRRPELARPTAAITDGRMGSLLVRVEYSTHAVPLHQVGTFRRDPERSITGAHGEAWWTDLRTMNTLEVARPGLGGDQGFDFTRLVSDSAVFLHTGRRSGIKLRGRAAGQIDGTLPAQKLETLGGWSALRGYGFKELVGDFSLLGTAEVTLSSLSFFVDGGSVRAAGSFSDPRASLGGSLNFGDDARLDLAWRADGEARFWPEIRLLFERTF